MSVKCWTLLPLSVMGNFFSQLISTRMESECARCELEWDGRSSSESDEPLRRALLKSNDERLDLGVNTWQTCKMRCDAPAESERGNDGEEKVVFLGQEGFESSCTIQRGK